MARFALLAILAIWMSWSKPTGAPSLHGFPLWVFTTLHLSFYVLLVLFIRVWSNITVRRSEEYASPTAYNWAAGISRWLIPAWFTIGIYFLHWGTIIESWLPWFYKWPDIKTHLTVPQTIIGTIPPLLAWMGLWWAQYPVDHMFREQFVFNDVFEEKTVHQPPTLSQTMFANFRLQILFTLVPILFLHCLYDLTIIILHFCGIAITPNTETLITLCVSIPGVAGVLIIGPIFLTWILGTERLEDSPLRTKLDSLFKSAKIGYREILLWKTNFTMGNAAVMGLIPQARYVLLSDLLMESMTDEHIEAVFAHEVGHVVHKHLWWFLVFGAIATLFMMGPGDQVMNSIKDWFLFKRNYSEDTWNKIEGFLSTAIFFGAFVVAFSYLSPAFERQADVYAARTLQKEYTAKQLLEQKKQDEQPSLQDQQPSEPQRHPEPELLLQQPVEIQYTYPADHVGEYGAGVFTGALRQVAIINHMPISQRNLSHGSIAHRMHALHTMSGDADHTAKFDRQMRKLYMILLAILCIIGIWAAVHMFLDDQATPTKQQPAPHTTIAPKNH